LPGLSITTSPSIGTTSGTISHGSPARDAPARPESRCGADVLERHSLFGGQSDGRAVPFRCGHQQPAAVSVEHVVVGSRPAVQPAS